MDREDAFELSPSQEIVWLHEQVSPTSRAYNFIAYLTLLGELDQPALWAALAQTLAHHDGLRLELVPTDDGRPWQRVNPDCGPRLASIDLSRRPHAEAEFQRLLSSEAATPFDTTRAPLLRWTLVRMSEREHRLIHLEHHLIHDGRSFLILFRDVFASYHAQLCGEPSSLPPARSYADHVRLVRAAGVDPEALRQWVDELDGAPTSVSLAGVGRAGTVRRNHGAQYMQEIDAPLAQRLRQDCRRRGTTVYCAMLALFAELIRRFSGQDDFVIGSAVASRGDGFTNAVGMFINTVPLRMRHTGQTGVADLVDEVTETVVRALPRQEVPIQQITRALRQHTRGVDNPLFNIAFSAVDDDLPQITVPGLEVLLSEGLNAGTTRFDLDVVLRPDARRTLGPRVGPGPLELQWDYDADMFTESDLRALGRHLTNLLRAYLDADPNTPVGDLAPICIDPSPLAAEPATAAPTDLTDLVTARARLTPQAPALLGPDTTLTYADLADRVVELAAKLTAAGAAGRPVAAVLPRGVDAILLLLACLRAQAVYCPLSPDEPPHRLAQLLDRLRPALLVSPARARTPGDWPTACLTDTHFPPAGDGPLLDGAAYVIHTSGSTGQPKPVLVGRRQLRHLVDAIQARYRLQSTDRVLAFTQPSFDVAFEEILPTLAVGGTLVVPPPGLLSGEDLVRLAARHAVTVVNLPTGYLMTVRDAIVQAIRAGHWQPRLIVVGGEQLPAAAVDPLLGTGVTLLNAYGVTEAGVTSTVHQISRDDLDTVTVPLGVELPGVRMWVLDAQQRPLPDGAVGELAVGGACLAECYLDAVEATAARFVYPASLGGHRVYLTGDRGFRDWRGQLRFLGRLDDQVKVRGYRIEPDEIRTCLLAHPQVADAHVTVDEAGRPEAKLVAHVAPEPGGPTAEAIVPQLRAHLAARLPPHLIPTTITVHELLPRTSTGKIDRNALAAHRRPEPVAPPVPTSQLQARIAAVWSAELGTAQVGIHDNFFDLGGHSLLLLRVHARLQAELGHTIATVDLFRHPTVADLAQLLTGATGQHRSSGLGRSRQVGQVRLASRRRRVAGPADHSPESLDSLDSPPEGEPHGQR